MQKLTAIVLAVALSALAVFGDWLLKLASLKTGFSGWKLLVIGAVVYGVGAVGWFFIFRAIKLSTVGVVYGVSVLLLLVALSVFVFKEGLNVYEGIGVVMAIGSIVLMSRFA